jgi:hypothetical protein
MNLITPFIHELFKILANCLKYTGKMETREKQDFFGTGWKARTTRFLAA